MLAATQTPPLANNELRLYWQPEANGPSSSRARNDTLLREVLAPLLRVPAHDLVFGREAKGRPFLDHPNAPDFNLSDTRGGTLIAICAIGRVGVDIECLNREFPVSKIASRWFSREEAAALARMTTANARQAFLRLWTAKEASCKATGTGIYGYLSQWCFDANSETPQLCSLPIDAGVAEQWQFIRLTPSVEYIATLTLKSASCPQVNAYTWGR